MELYYVCVCGLEIFLSEEYVYENDYHYCSECGEEQKTSDIKYV